MSAPQRTILMRDPAVPGLRNIDVYTSLGGYQALAKALTMDPAAVTELGGC